MFIIKCNQCGFMTKEFESFDDLRDNIINHGGKLECNESEMGDTVYTGECPECNSFNIEVED